ncbi:hypothetical protein F5Y15DRAFT_417626 [Xylariaceae sp. FL0016]|nr:hypothetical protein F5Y15DRAFT_417626 [Xylariaceae sp. FL0016]
MRLIEYLRSKRLDRPCTVCKGRDRTEFRDDGSKEDKVVTLFTSHFHSVCHLKGVKSGPVAHPEPIYRNAFQGRDYYNGRDHHWQSELRVPYEMEEYKGDSDRHGGYNGNFQALRQRSCFATGHDQGASVYSSQSTRPRTIWVRQAAARFGVLLKKTSMTPAKVQVGGSRARLNALMSDHTRHEEPVKTMTDKVRSQSESQYRTLTQAS